MKKKKKTMLGAGRPPRDRRQAPGESLLIVRGRCVLGSDCLTEYFLRSYNAMGISMPARYLLRANLVLTSLLHSLVCVFPTGLVNAVCRTLGTQNFLQLWQNHRVHLCTGTILTGEPNLSVVTGSNQVRTMCFWCLSSQ